MFPNLSFHDFPNTTNVCQRMCLTFAWDKIVFCDPKVVFQRIFENEIICVDQPCFCLTFIFLETIFFFNTEVVFQLFSRKSCFVTENPLIDYWRRQSSKRRKRFQSAAQEIGHESPQKGSQTNQNIMPQLLDILCLSQ